jgi:Rod binding domain-containing protein
MNPIAPLNATATASSPERSKALQAGMQFEAVLLNTVLGSLEHTFSRLPGGKEEDHASEGYGSMAMQALTSGLARSGGIGLGKIIAAALLKNSHGSNQTEREPVTAGAALFRRAF